MRDLNDNDFDKVFKSRINEAFPEFEEESWVKMEAKLRKKDRLIFFRYASIVLLFLSFGVGFYFITQQAQHRNGDSAIAKGKVKPAVVTKGNSVGQSNPTVKNNTNPALANANGAAIQVFTNQLTKPKIQQKDNRNNGFDKNVLVFQSAKKVDERVEAISSPKQQTEVNNAITAPNREAIIQNQNSIAQNAAINIETPTPVLETPDLLKTDSATKKKITAKIKRKIPISLAISAGPDFNSTSTLIGGKTSAAFGIGIGIGLSKKLTLQTGLGFGFKNYDANSYDYTFNNPNTQATIENVKAACKVLEIPIRASYLLSQNQQRSISFNAGLSSYFMLKENYVYVYTAASGRKDRINDFTNQNQHILSVVDLSATYNIKLKNKNLGFGIEPYVKIPLTGIGEGRVPLKSSGISLKLNYEFNKN